MRALGFGLRRRPRGYIAAVSLAEDGTGGQESHSCIRARYLLEVRNNYRNLGSWRVRQLRQECTPAALERPHEFAPPVARQCGHVHVPFKVHPFPKRKATGVGGFPSFVLHFARPRLKPGSCPHERCGGGGGGVLLGDVLGLVLFGLVEFGLVELGLVEFGLLLGMVVEGEVLLGFVPGSAFGGFAPPGVGASGIAFGVGIVSGGVVGVVLGLVPGVGCVDGAVLGVPGVGVVLGVVGLGG